MEVGVARQDVMGAAPVTEVIASAIKEMVFQSVKIQLVHPVAAAVKQNVLLVLRALREPQVVVVVLILQIVITILPILPLPQRLCQPLQGEAVATLTVGQVSAVLKKVMGLVLLIMVVATGFVPALSV
ncbi:MAG TPA: hypothetical protein PLV82_04280 [bacterium]|nr:hypothetical protein [bacterium]